MFSSTGYVKNNSTPESNIPEYLYNNLYDCLLSCCKCRSSDEIIEFYGIQFTYAKFKQLVENTKLALHFSGISAGEKVVLSLITTPESIALMYACNALGIIPVMADIRLSEKEYANLMKETDAKFLFINDFMSNYCFHFARTHPEWKVYIVSPCDSAFGMVRSMQKLRCILTGNTYVTGSLFCPNVGEWRSVLKLFADQSPIDNPHTRGEEEIVFTTSGTTGARKYVVLNSFQLNLSAFQHFSFNSTESLESIHTVLSVMPIFACYGFVISVHAPLLLSKRIVLHPISNASKIPKAIIKYKPNFYSGVYDHYERLLKAKCLKNADLSFLRLLYYGGEHCDAAQIEKINVFLADHNCPAKLLQGYGMTEVASSAVSESDRDEYIPGSVGKALPYTKICIVREGTTEPVGTGEEGEICLQTPCQLLHYYGNPSATQELLRRHDDGKTWVHTGDWGYLDEDGNLFVKGRMKQMLVSASGTKIFPSVIADRVSAITFVDECAIVVRQGDKSLHDSTIILLVVPKRKAKNRLLAKKTIRVFCRRELPAFLRPDHIITCSSIPKTNSGKIDYSALEKKVPRRLVAKKRLQ